MPLFFWPLVLLILRTLKLVHTTLLTLLLADKAALTNSNHLPWDRTRWWWASSEICITKDRAIEDSLKLYYNCNCAFISGSLCLILMVHN
ncbi:hypothetical protein B0F90DRAFT_1727730 [Multifurca ochricompacta]|uniref:Secreted protein n=1 Tax=Multifurca ochricompacta TaxID=376703 RepID=A0AAD4M3A8_9AGAM|nr:hypothetical protein B0F90DRAFT_1727730 [Multifurca ochricompacta]